MHSVVHLKLRQHACSKPNTPSSSPRNILNNNNNDVHSYGENNKRHLKGHLYDTNKLNYFIDDLQHLCLLHKNNNSSIIDHLVTHRP